LIHFYKRQIMASREDSDGLDKLFLQLE